MSQILPPDEERARIYQTKNFTEVRVLLPDGSVVDALPVDVDIVTEGISTAANQTNGDRGEFSGEKNPMLRIRRIA